MKLTQSISIPPLGIGFPKRRSLLMPALLALLSGTTAMAQQYYDPGILQSPITQVPPDYAAPGMKLGAFNLSPELEAAAEWHDNIFYQNRNPVSDTIYHLRPKAALTSGWSRHALNVTAMADFARFADDSSEDYDDYLIALDGRVDVKRGKFFTLRAASMWLHEDRSSPDDPGGITPTNFNLDRYSIGYSHNINRLTASLTWDRDVTDYDNNVNADSDFIDNSDRNRTQEGLTLRMDYLQAPQRSLFASLGANTVRYDRADDFEGFVRDSDGIRARAGVAFDITGVLTGDLYAQYLKQEYDDSRFADSNRTGIGMGLNWFPTQLTSVHFRAEHAPLETTQAYTSGYLASLYSVRVQHELRRWLLLHARVSYTDNEYKLTPEAPEDSLTDTQVTRAGLGLSYLFNRHVRLTAGYAWEDQDANRVIDQYSANRYYLVLGFSL